MKSANTFNVAVFSHVIFISCFSKNFIICEILENTKENLTSAPTKSSKTSKSGNLVSNAAFRTFLSADIPLDPAIIETKCTSFMEHFGKKGASFVECSVSHARPLTFCEACVNEYYDVTSIYDTITKLMDQSLDGLASEKCRDILLSSDVVQVVGQTYNFIHELWTGSACDKCFKEAKSSNGTTIHEKSDNVLHFLDLRNQTKYCFERFLENNGNSTTYNNSACDECFVYYDSLNKFYEQDMNGDDDIICMDIVDIMNYTRHEWSKSFECKYTTHDAASVLTLSAIFCCLPIVFYITARFLGVRDKRKILKQKRLASRKSFLRTQSNLADEVRSNQSEADMSESDGENLYQPRPGCSHYQSTVNTNKPPTTL